MNIEDLRYTITTTTGTVLYADLTSGTICETAQDMANDRGERVWVTSLDGSDNWDVDPE